MKIKKITTILSTIVLTTILSFSIFTNNALAKQPISHAAEDAKAYLIEPQDGEIVPSSFEVKFGLSGMEIAPAGVEQDNSGHHHLLIDLPQVPSLTTALPANEHIKHFGKGQTETSLELEPGEHTLQLIVGDYAHTPHDHPVISEKIKVIVSSEN